MNFWEYLLTPTGMTLGPVALFTMIGGMVLIIGGIGVVVVFRKRKGRIVPRGEGAYGWQEQEVVSEFWTKCGLGLVVWSFALVLALLFRVLGTPGLNTRFLVVFVLAAFPLGFGYPLIYRFFFYPRYRHLARSLDQRRIVMQGKKKKEEKTVTIALMPMKALAGLALAPVLYYLIMTSVSIPPSVPPNAHDHALHQLGMVVLALLGYLIGLTSSLGDSCRERLSWLNPVKK